MKDTGREENEDESTVVYLVVIPLSPGPFNLLQTLFTEGSHLFHLLSRGLGGRHKDKTDNWNIQYYYQDGIKK